MYWAKLFPFLSDSPIIEVTLVGHCNCNFGVIMNVVYFRQSFIIHVAYMLLLHAANSVPRHASSICNGNESTFSTVALSISGDTSFAKLEKGLVMWRCTSVLNCNRYMNSNFQGSIVWKPSIVWKTTFKFYLSSWSSLPRVHHFIISYFVEWFQVIFFLSVISNACAVFPVWMGLLVLWQLSVHICRWKAQLEKNGRYYSAVLFVMVWQA